jgi:hypothetical protein
MTILRLLACGSVLLFAAGCSSSTGGNAGGGPDSGGSDGTTDGTQSGSEGGVDGAGDSGNGTGDAPSDTGSAGDSTSTPDSPYDAGPPGDATSCPITLSLCNGYCFNENNDIHNCGGCGTVCQGTDPYCDNGHCTTAPCDGGACSTAMFCCGSDCCTAGQLCCVVPSGAVPFPKCTDPVNGTCPVGCLGCP